MGISCISNEIIMNTLWFMKDFKIVKILTVLFILEYKNILCETVFTWIPKAECCKSVREQKEDMLGYYFVFISGSWSAYRIHV